MSGLRPHHTTPEEIECARPVERNRCSGAAALTEGTGTGAGDAVTHIGVMAPVLRGWYGRRRGEAALDGLGVGPEGFQGGRLG